MGLEERAVDPGLCASDPRARGGLAHLRPGAADIQLSDAAKYLINHPGVIPAELVPPDIRAEIVEWSQVVAGVILYSAWVGVQIDDGRVAVAVKSPSVRDQMIADKLVAWEWFFGPWQSAHGNSPRIELEIVCRALHIDPGCVRARVRVVAVPPTQRMPPGFRCVLYRDRDPDDEDGESYWGVVEDRRSRCASSSPALLPRLVSPALPPKDVVRAVLADVPTIDVLSDAAPEIF